MNGPIKPPPPLLKYVHGYHERTCYLNFFFFLFGKLTFYPTIHQSQIIKLKFSFYIFIINMQAAGEHPV